MLKFPKPIHHGPDIGDDFIRITRYSQGWVPKSLYARHLRYSEYILSPKIKGCTESVWRPDKGGRGKNWKPQVFLSLTYESTR